MGDLLTVRARETSCLRASSPLKRLRGPGRHLASPFTEDREKPGAEMEPLGWQGWPSRLIGNLAKSASDTSCCGDQRSRRAKDSDPNRPHSCRAVQSVVVAPPGADFGVITVIQVEVPSQFGGVGSHCSGRGGAPADSVRNIGAQFCDNLDARVFRRYE